MFSFFKKKPPAVAVQPVEVPPPVPALAPVAQSPTALELVSVPTAEPLSKPPVEPAAAAEPTLSLAAEPPAAEPRRKWLDRLKQGLRKTGSSFTQVFTGTRIDDALYEQLEAALLMADAGLPATQHLLADLKRRVKEHKAGDAAL
jgi:fused signal recognition particle receptor